jgi:DNA-binding winged helix-turn-helix (wHTH) protein
LTASCFSLAICKFGQQRVTRAGVEIALPNLSFQLLLALIRVAPNVLSNDLLMARVWPGLIVSPETVAKRVNLLREALGDSAEEPRYIAGVRSRGYRLVATVSPARRPVPTVGGPLSTPVVVTQPDELSTQDTVATEPRTATAKPSRIWWLVLPVLLAAIQLLETAGGWSIFLRPVANSIGARNPRLKSVCETLFGTDS